MKYEDLTPEQQEKAKACKTPEDILALAKAEGYELSDEQLETITGGEEWWDPRCSEYHAEPGERYPHPAM